MTDLGRVIMGANIAGIYGAQIFRQDDRPRYRRAFSVNCAVLAFGLSLAILRYIDDRIRRKKNMGASAEAGASDSDVSQIEKDKAEVAPPPSDDQPAPVVYDADRKLSVSQGLRATT